MDAWRWNPLNIQHPPSASKTWNFLVCLYLFYTVLFSSPSTYMSCKKNVQFTFTSWLVSFLSPTYYLLSLSTSISSTFVMNIYWTHTYITSCSQHSFFLPHINNTAVVLVVEFLQAEQPTITSTCQVETTRFCRNYQWRPLYWVCLLTQKELITIAYRMATNQCI